MELMSVCTELMTAASISAPRVVLRTTGTGGTDLSAVNTLKLNARGVLPQHSTVWNGNCFTNDCSAASARARAATRRSWGRPTLPGFESSVSDSPSTLR